MATNPPLDLHISFEFLTGSPVDGGSPCCSVALTVVDHRFTVDLPPVLFPCPRSYPSPRHYRAALKDIATDLCDRRLHILPCCVITLVPEVVAKIAAVAADHHCGQVQSVELHVFPYMSTAGEILRDLFDANEILRESFDAAGPKPTPASLGSIEKLIAEKEGDDDSSCSSKEEDGDGSCMICLDEIMSRRSSLKMPCSHVFHENCIVEWLKVSHVCPLCRYEMPVDDHDAANSDSLA